MAAKWEEEVGAMEDQFRPAGNYRDSQSERARYAERQPTQHVDLRAPSPLGDRDDLAAVAVALTRIANAMEKILATMQT